MTEPSEDEADLHRRKGPVRWLSPKVLAQSLTPLVLSKLFTRFSDRREVEAVRRQGLVYCSDADELWVDYVADTGDGFDAAATVASLLAPEVLMVDGECTEAGSLLVLGGDQVYPFASKAEYEDRFVKPFRAMLPFASADHHRVAVAVPGNHDWYDGLTAFQQIFCGGEWIGGWKTEQRRSYFACRLPHGWWLWAIDIQLDTYIDHPQIEYFTRMARRIDPGDCIILCWAKPAWVTAAEEGQRPSQDAGPAAVTLQALKAAVGAGAELTRIPQAYKTLDYFQRRVVPAHADIRLSLTGDSHHYARYEAPGGEQKITAGLGGAFLSATHHLPRHIQLPSRTEDGEAVSFQRRWEYPACADTKRLRRRVLRAVYGNRGFPLLPALAYAGIAAARTRTRRAPAATGAAGFAAVAVCVAFSKQKKPKDWAPGAIHGLFHVVAALGSTWLIRRGAGRRSTAVLGAGVVGATVGPALLGLYLVVADGIGLFGRNTNELYSALAIEDHKGFLRLHFTADGGLTIYPIRVEKVARWTPDGIWPGHPAAPRFSANPGPVATLIEPPIPVTRTP